MFSSANAFNAAIDALQSAGVGQASWTDVSREVAVAVGADASAVVVWRGPRNEVEVLEGQGHDPALVREYSEHYYQHDILLEDAPFDGCWQVSTERFPEARFGSHPFFGDLMHRHRVRQILALSLKVNDELKAALTFHRFSKAEATSADFATGEGARLTQAALTAFSKRYDRAQAFRSGLEAALSGSHSECFLTDAAGNTRPLGPTSPSLHWSRLRVANGKATHADASAHRRLLRLFADAAAGVEGAISVPGGPGVALRVRAKPLPAAAKLADNQALALVSVESRTLERLPSEADLQALFELTPTQARVLRMLCEGLAPKECAQELGGSEATVRTHIAHLMLKLDCSRQSQLVRAALLLA